MKIKEQHILRLTIDYPIEGRDEVFDYLDKRFGTYNFNIKRMGIPKVGGSQMIVEIEEQDVLQQIIEHPHLKIHNTGRKGRFWPEIAAEVRELL